MLIIPVIKPERGHRNSIVLSVHSSDIRRVHFLASVSALNLSSAATWLVWLLVAQCLFSSIGDEVHGLFCEQRMFFLKEMGTRATLYTH